MQKLRSFIWIALSCILLPITSISLSGCIKQTQSTAANIPYINISLPTLHLGTSTTPSKTAPIVLLLPLQGKYATSGESVRAGFLMAAKKHHIENRVIVWDTTTDTIPHLYEKAVSQAAEIIVGPLQKSEVETFMHELNPSIPVLTLNTLDTTTSKKNIYQFGLSPEDEIRDSVNHAWEDGQRNALILVPDNSWGKHIAQLFSDTWHTMGGTVLDTIYYQPNTMGSERIHLLLQARSTHPTAILLAASPEQARQLYPLLRSYKGGNIPTYATALIYSGKPNITADQDLDGITFCDVPWVLDPTQPRYSVLSMETSENKGNEARLYALGLDAFSITMALTSPNTHSWPIDGVTGILKLNVETQRITRQLPCAQFRQGIPVVSSFPMTIER